MQVSLWAAMKELFVLSLCFLNPPLQIFKAAPNTNLLKSKPLFFFTGHVLTNFFSHCCFKSKATKGQTSEKQDTLPHSSLLKVCHSLCSISEPTLHSGPSIPPHTEEDQVTFLVAPVQLIFPRLLKVRLLIHVVSHGAWQSAHCG